jgi:hypothetical protein
MSILSCCKLNLMTPEPNHQTNSTHQYLRSLIKCFQTNDPIVQTLCSEIWHESRVYLRLCAFPCVPTSTTPQLWARKCLENTSRASPMTSCKLCLYSTPARGEGWVGTSTSPSLTGEGVEWCRSPISMSRTKNIQPLNQQPFQRIRR